MQSGSVFNPWARGYQNTQLFAKKLNIDTKNEKEIIDTLMEFSKEQLLEFQDNLGDVSKLHRFSVAVLHILSSDYCKRHKATIWSNSGE